MSTIVTLDLPQGKIMGEKVILSHEKLYYKFFGIPYAKPPVGSLRFQNPQPLEHFPKELLDCTKQPNSSLQFNAFTKEVTGSEDCLYLNVYSPDVTSENKFPVIVYIHGGGFMTGYGNRHILYPKFLIEENVILVTVNYRLGAFGFLSLPDGGISGNYGLKDQQLALKWIQENITSFNGDPKNVTLFGQSAGAASAHFHFLCNESRKYFHKLICHSGLATMEWAISQNAQEKAFKLAECLGFTGNAVDTAHFLQKFENSHELIASMYKVLSKEERGHFLRLPFGPVIESPNSEKPFITKNPIDIIKTEQFAESIPIIMGYTSQEGIMLMAYSSKTVEEIDLDLSCLIPSTICEPESHQCKNIVNKVRKFYFNGKSIEDVSKLCEALGDICFVVDFHKTVELHNEYQSQSPLYCFKFAYDGKLNFYKVRYKYEHIKGACHGDELYYLFYPNEAAEHVQPSEQDLQMVKTLCKVWTSFSKYGNPTPDKKEKCSENIDFVWNPLSKLENKKFSFDCLEIDNKFAIVKDPDGERVEFWKQLLFETKRNY
ncbi:juvenile hormone esterase-like [Condylostylus longicornis]|uniref:juvenile hormone esterase-like n=1 Tax=Condylostylus longicornis TaxID=2530218 RepID=UPI00244DAAB8|nr:juvenile hormone esterase-like [Condylostylus longicornis]XP_055390459.1 juvenile hormone esterase-like [Condylostylus longicornis]XP_055390460.1 juvenile hormone esterase-like [Condylostylus longicornis]